MKRLIFLIFFWLSLNSFAQNISEQQEFFSTNSWVILEANAERGYWYSPLLLSRDAKNTLTFYYATTNADSNAIATLDKVNLDCANGTWTPTSIGDRSRDSSQFAIAKGTIYSNTQSKLCGFGEPSNHMAYLGGYIGPDKHFNEAYMETKYSIIPENRNLKSSIQYIFDKTDKKWIGKTAVVVDCSDPKFAIYNTDTDYKLAKMIQIPPVGQYPGPQTVSWDRLCKPHGSLETLK